MIAQQFYKVREHDSKNAHLTDLWPKRGLSIKCIAKRLPGAHRTARKDDRISQESGILQRVQGHPNIVIWEALMLDETMLDGQRMPTGFSLVTRLCLFGDLSQVARLRLSKDRCRRLIAQVASALEWLHSDEINVIHRDVKPGNIFLDSLDHARLGDFGFAILNEPETLAEQKTNLVGTPLYIAPELLRNPENRRESPKRDVWALGCCYHFVLTGGKLPFSPRTYNTVESLYDAIVGHAVRLSFELTDHELDVIHRMLCPSPKRRPSASQVLERLLTTSAGDVEQDACGSEADDAEPAQSPGGDVVSTSLANGQQGKQNQE